MNKQKLNEPSAHKEDGVEKRRRFIKSAGLAAPVVLSLANRSAFGAAAGCLSQQVSGNVSQAGAGSCSSGSSPLAWQSPTIVTANICTISGTSATPSPMYQNYSATVKISGDSKSYNLVVTISSQKKTPYYWNDTGNVYQYGTLTILSVTTTLKTSGNNAYGSFTITSISNINPSGSKLFSTASPNNVFTTGNKKLIINETDGSLIRTVSTSNSTYNSTDFTGGTTFSSAFGYAAKNSASTLSMREILSTANSGQDANCVAALLNAAYTPASPPYVLTVLQVKDLCKSTASPTPSYTDLASFLASTWLNQP
jgi:hypothetical protein